MNYPILFIFFAIEICLICKDLKNFTSASHVDRWFSPRRLKKMNR